MPSRSCSSGVTLLALCFLLGACMTTMTTPNLPLDLREYTHDGPGFPARDLQVQDSATIQPTVREGRLAVRIGGVQEELETLTVMPPGEGPFPLALISHGTPADEARGGRLRQFLPLAESFARRGYRAVVFARRGYGSSTGARRDKPRVMCGYWPTRAYLRAAGSIADEYVAALEAVVQLPEVNGSKVVGVGQSTGGLGVLALASRGPPGLIGVINFAGGHGSNGRRGVCNGRALTHAFAAVGKNARVPALWLHSTTDQWFWPSLTRRNFDRYVAGGAPARLEMLGPLWFSKDGHQLFMLGGRELWQPRISTFLRDIGAPGWQLDPASATVARLAPPTGLAPAQQAVWLRYLGSADHKAFAVGSNGWGRATARRSQREADQAALAFCEEYTTNCRIVDAENVGDGAEEWQPSGEWEQAGPHALPAFNPR